MTFLLYMQTLCYVCVSFCVLHQLYIFPSINGLICILWPFQIVTCIAFDVEYGDLGYQKKIFVGSGKEHRASWKRRTDWFIRHQALHVASDAIVKSTTISGMVSETCYYSEIADQLVRSCRVRKCKVVECGSANLCGILGFYWACQKAREVWKFYSHLFPLSGAWGAAVSDLFQQHSVAKPAICSRPRDTP